MEVMIAKAKKKGTFIFVDSPREGEGYYDIYFVPYGGWEGEYICTFPDRETAAKLCQLYEKVHNAAVEAAVKKELINTVLEEVAKEVHNDPEFDAILDGFDELPPIEQHRRIGLAREFIRSKLEIRLPEIERIKGRELTEEEIGEYIEEIEEWYC